MLESRGGTIWSESVIPTLREKDAIGPTLELQCARHEVRRSRTKLSRSNYICKTPPMAAIARQSGGFVGQTSPIIRKTEPEDNPIRMNYSVVEVFGGSRRARRTPAGHG